MIPRLDVVAAGANPDAAMATIKGWHPNLDPTFRERLAANWGLVHAAQPAAADLAMTSHARQQSAFR